MREKRYYPAQPPQLPRRATRMKTGNADIAASQGGAVRRKVMKLDGSGEQCFGKECFARGGYGISGIETKKDSAHIQNRMLHIQSLVSTNAESTWVEVETKWYSVRARRYVVCIEQMELTWMSKARQGRPWALGPAPPICFTAASINERREGQRQTPYIKSSVYL